MTDKQNLVVDAVLDSLSATLNINCSWIQIAGSTGKAPYLASYRNFTEQIYSEMSHMDKNHPLLKEVIGLGNKLIVTNLSMDGAYGMAFFERAGFHSLIAVPITTYKVLGIMGAVDRKKNRFDNDFTQLFAVVANLVGIALSKNTKAQLLVSENDSIPISNNTIYAIKSGIKESKTVIDNRKNNDYDENPDDGIATFRKHDRKMGTFRESHN